MMPIPPIGKKVTAGMLLLLVLALTGCTTYESGMFNLQPLSEGPRGFELRLGCLPTDQGMGTQECPTLVNEQPAGIMVAAPLPKQNAPWRPGFR